MYVAIGLFLLYVFCIDKFMGEWIMSFFDGIGAAVDYVGFWQLANTIDALGYKAVHGGGLFVTAGVLTAITCALLGEKLINELDAGAMN